MDPHSYFADPDPTVLLNADPGPVAFSVRMRIRIQLNKPGKNYFMKFAVVEKEADPNVNYFKLLITNSLHFFCYFKFFPPGSMR